MGTIHNFTIVMPCYNEAHRIAESLPELYNWRQEFESQNDCQVHVIFANDGSRDSTVTIVENLSRNEKNVQIVGYEKNQGRGQALKIAFAAAPLASKFTLYMDADLATDLRHVQDVYDLYCKESKPFMICGNRYYPGHELKRPLLRKIWSWGWRTFMSLLFWKKLPDTQCGFKALNAELIPAVMTHLQIKGFVADVEMVLRCVKAKAPIYSLNIAWTEKKGSTIRWSTILKMLGEVFELKKNLSHWLKDTAPLAQHDSYIAMDKRAS